MTSEQKRIPIYCNDYNHQSWSGTRIRERLFYIFIGCMVFSPLWMELGSYLAKASR